MTYSIHAFISKVTFRNFSNLNTEPDSIAAMHMMFAGKVNLSMENYVNDSLFNLIVEAIKLGQSIPYSDPAAIYTQISRTSFKNILFPMEMNFKMQYYQNTEKLVILHLLLILEKKEVIITLLF